MYWVTSKTGLDFVQRECYGARILSHSVLFMIYQDLIVDIPAGYSNTNGPFKAGFNAKILGC